jgi:mannosyltransferase OCH1-like enzyme
MTNRSINRMRGGFAAGSRNAVDAFLCVTILFAISSLFIGSRLLLQNEDATSTTLIGSRSMTRSNAPGKHRKYNKYKKSPPPLPQNERFTSHFCHSRDYVNGNAQRASCLFHNVCIVQRPSNSNSQGNNNRHEIEFLYVYKDGSSNGSYDDHKIKQRIKNGDASFTLGVGPHSGDERVVFTPVPVAMDELNVQYPQREYVTGTSVLFYEYNAENFGHLLTDVLLPVYAALQGFGLEHYSDITLFRYSIMDAIGWSCDFHRRKADAEGGVSSRYGNVGKHCDRFYSMVPEFMFVGNRPLQVLNGTTVQPTCFQNLVVGMGMYSDDCDVGFERETNVWSLCNHSRQSQFWQFRNYLLQNALGNAFDEDDVPTHHKITITQRNDKIRGLANLDQLIGMLREKYEGLDGNNVEVVVVEWEKLSLKDQLDLIRTTTVHLTPPGGVSFIALFLPRWSTSIRLYSGDFMMEWNLMNYLGYIAVDYVDCQRGTLCPVDEVLDFVEEGLKRYDEYRVGDASWTPYSGGNSPSRSFAELPSSGSSIPKIVYQSWISRDMAPKMRANLNKWTSLNDKTYRFVFFDDNEQRDWMKENCTEYWPAWKALQLPAARADLFRYCILYVDGGVWSDIDVEPILPLSDFIRPEASAELIVVQDGGMPGDGFLYNAFLAAVPRHPVLKRSMDIVRGHYKIRLEEGAVFCTGPHVLWRAVNDTTSGQVQPKTFVGLDTKHKIEYLSFSGETIASSTHELMIAKYGGYLEDATLHGGEPHYGRKVTWSSEV